MRWQLGCNRLGICRRAGFATASGAGPRWVSGRDVEGSSATAVSGPMFTELLRKCGLSKKRLHSLYSGEGGLTAPSGEFPIAVALSGGGDSMALMLLLQEHLQHRRIQTPLLAITVDHQLRAESTEEAEQLSKVCRERWNVHHIVRQCEWSDGDLSEASSRTKPRASKLEEAARVYRYDLLKETCRQHSVRCLFVGHTIGDQLETMLFRLGRASGINGLAGMARVSHLAVGDRTVQSPVDPVQAMPNTLVVDLMRPLLSVSKSELRATCDRFNQPWVEDPENNNLAYDRVRIRQELERLESEQGLPAVDLLSRFQQSASAAKMEFARAERKILRKYTLCRTPELVVLKSDFLHDREVFAELRSRIFSAIVTEIGTKDSPPRLESVNRLIRDLEHLEIGKKVTLSGCCISIKAKGHELHFQPERRKPTAPSSQ